jgi:hypothetical protein
MPTTTMNRLTRSIHPKDTRIIPPLPQIDLLHPIQRLKKSPPELMPRMLSIRDRVEPAFLLQLDDILDGSLFDRDEGFG